MLSKCILRPLQSSSGDQTRVTTVWRYQPCHGTRIAVFQNPRYETVRFGERYDAVGSGQRGWCSRPRQGPLVSTAPNSSFIRPMGEMPIAPCLENSAVKGPQPKEAPSWAWGPGYLQGWWYLKGSPSHSQTHPKAGQHCTEVTHAVAPGHTRPLLYLHLLQSLAYPHAPSESSALCEADFP